MRAKKQNIVFSAGGHGYTVRLFVALIDLLSASALPKGSADFFVITVSIDNNKNGGVQGVCGNQNGYQVR